MTLVLDASMAIAWFFPEERRPDVHTVLDRVEIEGAVVPSLWRLEVANVLWHARRAKRCDETYVIRGLTTLGQLSIDIDPETDRNAWGHIRDLSNEHDLTVYDAAYLELALRRSLPLATLDQALIRAARRAHVEILAG